MAIDTDFKNRLYWINWAFLAISSTIQGVFFAAAWNGDAWIRLVPIPFVLFTIYHIVVLTSGEKVRQGAANSKWLPQTYAWTMGVAAVGLTIAGILTGFLEQNNPYVGLGLLIVGLMVLVAGGIVGQAVSFYMLLN